MERGVEEVMRSGVEGGESSAFVVQSNGLLLHVSRFLRCEPQSDRAEWPFEGGSTTPRATAAGAAAAEIAAMAKALQPTAEEAPVVRPLRSLSTPHRAPL